MNYTKMMKYDTSNWDGITATIFFSGCKFHCPGCFNQEAWDFNHGQPFDKEAEDLFIEYAKSPHVTGICLLGGEVFQQDLDAMYKFVLRIKNEVGKPIHAWTGYLFEDLIKDPKTLSILCLIDTLVDGRFVMALKDLNLKYRGSSNQRVIDVDRSMLEWKVVLIDC